MSPQTLSHGILMILAAALIVTAIVRARQKEAEGWLNIHKKFAIAGLLCALAAFDVMFLFKQLKGYPHFKSLHAVAGLLSVQLLVLAPFLGSLVIPGQQALRSFHRFLGRLTALAVLTTALLGIWRILEILRIVED